jgi:hypothetical protein
MALKQQTRSVHDRNTTKTVIDRIRSKKRLRARFTDGLVPWSLQAVDNDGFIGELKFSFAPLFQA